MDKIRKLFTFTTSKYPHQISIKLNHADIRYEINEWCENNIGNRLIEFSLKPHNDPQHLTRWAVVFKQNIYLPEKRGMFQEYIYYFKEKRHALLFSLRWRGIHEK